MKNIYAEICKVNDEQRMVYGYASTEAMDVQGERVSKDALAKALPEYMRFANIREMHQPSAVGVAKSAEIDDKGLYIACKVVDESAWEKVKEGVYKGFSIGGKAVSKVDETITEMRLSEISLVDRPANPEAVIEVWKADGVQSPAQASAIDQLAELLDKGAITPERLIELAKGDVPATEPTEPPAEEPAAEVPADEAPAADAPADAAKADADADVKKGFEGEEVWDTATALDALNRIMGLLYSERAEKEKEPEQIKALEDAVAAIKSFIVSEIQEDNKPAPEADMAYADQGGDIAKAGKAISAKNMEKVQAMHDHCCDMGAKCAKGDDMAMSDAGGDIAKSDTIAKAVEDAIAKAVAPLKDELTKAHQEIEKLKDLPAPGKALLRAVAKGDDFVSEEATMKAATVVDAKGSTNEAASLIKMIHQMGGVR
jgi:HK97 family phage prohead protease